MFDMTNDSSLFHTRESWRLMGYTLEGNHFVDEEGVYLPLYEGERCFTISIIRFRRLSEETQFRAGPIDPTTEQHKDPDFLVMPRYWVEDQNRGEQIRNDDQRMVLVRSKNVQVRPTNEHFFGTINTSLALEIVRLPLIISSEFRIIESVLSC